MNDERPAVHITDLRAATKIYMLPNLLTAGNLFFGFLAIIRCIQARYGVLDEVMSRYYYTQAVWFILGSFVCDTLDGRVARMGGKESLFGKEFDSLADVISFGMAPALMMFFLILSPTEGYPFFRQVGWLTGFIYLLCGAVRLARFNVLTHPLLVREHPEDSKASSFFVGLPIPAAAGVVASLVLAINDLDLRAWSIILLPLMLLIAYLMVSNIPYPNFKNITWTTQTKVRTFVGIVITITIGLLFKELTFALIFLTYVFYGVFAHVKKVWRRRFKSPQETQNIP
jgi:CDP-diacylglycerol---serine O-phosphatidyltransferase